MRAIALRSDSAARAALALAAAATAAVVLGGCTDRNGVTAPRPSAELAASDRPSLDRAAAPGHDTRTVLVMLKSHVADVPAHAERLAARHGGRTRRVWAGLGALALELPAHAAEQVRARLAEDDDVAAAAEDAPVTLDATTVDPPSWGLDRIDERTRPMDGFYTFNRQGAGVHVYILDSGIRATHAEFGGRVSTSANFIPDGRSAKSDCLGHGTHVASTVGGATAGVARQVTLHSVRVVACDSSQTIFNLLDGINWVKDNGVRNMSIVNMSLGTVANTVLDLAVDNMANAGFFLVTSAGNDGMPACAKSPARASKAYAVGATTSLDRRRTSSNFGSCVDIFAPGQSIMGADAGSTTGLVSMSGTSMAAPHVAGAAALLLSKGGSAYLPILGALLSGNATMGEVVDAGIDSPNRLLYMGFIN